MPSAPSNQPSNIRQRLKAQALRAKAHAQRAKAHARRAAAHSRRLLAAALIAGTLTLASGGLSQSPSYALDTVSSIDAARTSDLLSNHCVNRSQVSKRSSRIANRFKSSCSTGCLAMISVVGRLFKMS